uniref:IS3 family transposase n=1 Tax=Schlesneria paludicola TaxID=360056 RepID=UPI00029AB996|nr:IS3 family transposase [Schlesneria paludicola]
MKYQFIDDHRMEWPAAIQYRVLAVSRSGYYAWRKRPISEASQRRQELTCRIRAIHAMKYHDVYGAPRLQVELESQGHPCNRKTVAKCMKEAGIKASTVKTFRVTTTDSNHSHPVAANIVDRDFAPSQKHQTWTTDITYIATDEGWLYLAAVEDLHSRKIVGWSMSDRIDSRLVVDALQMAVQRELPKSGLVAHSDRGVQYASEHYQTLLKQNGITCSMSRKGNCWDNAPMESFFATLKKELVHRERYLTRSQACQSLFEYIETFYNRVRRHSTIGYLLPIKFEQAV